VSDLARIHMVIVPARKDPVFLFVAKEDAERFQGAVMVGGGEAILDEAPICDSATTDLLIETEVA
jgi:hypothetical protein